MHACSEALTLTSTFSASTFSACHCRLWFQKEFGWFYCSCISTVCHCVLEFKDKTNKNFFYNIKINHFRSSYIYLPLFTVYCCETPSSWVSAADKSVTQDVYLCCPVDPALFSFGSPPADTRGEAKRKPSLYLDCRFSEADAQSCFRLEACS